MAGLLSRFTTFLPNTTILSNDHNQELNRIVNLLNGTTTNLKTVLKTSDAGDPPLEVDQLGAGPILELFQGGILKASFGNDGSLTIANANPAIVFDDTAGTDAKIDLDASVLRLGSTSVNHITLDVSTGIATFAQIPVGPASNPTTASQLARKEYIDTRTTAFSLAFGIADPSTPTVGAVIPGTVTWVCPPGFTVTLTQSKVVYQSGSHTAGGSVTFQLQRRLASGSWATPTNFGDVTLDDTNNAAFNVYTNNFSDVSFAEGDTIIMFISARTPTISERDVSVILQGTQRVSNN